MSTLENQNNLYGMKENIYLKVLEIGFRNETTGISFDDVVKELGIKEDFAINSTISKLSLIADEKVELPSKK